MKSDDRAPAGASWYVVLSVPGLARLRQWPFQPGTEREEFLFWLRCVRGRELFALIAAAPESVRSQLSARLRAVTTVESSRR